MSLRSRIEQSEGLATVLARLAGAYLGFCDRTIRWQTEGLDELAEAVAQGPVVIVMWHERSIMAALHWPFRDHALSSLYAKSPIGRVSGALQRSRGLQAIEMSDKTTNIAASRMILKRVKAGVSVGLTGDGPLGPARVMQDAPLDWARVTGVPVFGYAFATSRGRQLSTWDRMRLPYPWGRGARAYARFSRPLSRKMRPEELEAWRADFAAFLTTLTDHCDTLAGARITSPPVPKSPKD